MIQITGVRRALQLPELITALKEKIEDILNLKTYEGGPKTIGLQPNQLYRLAFITGLSLNTSRRLEDIQELKLDVSGWGVHDTAFSRGNRMPLWSAVLKIRYKSLNIDWENDEWLVHQVVNYEMIQGSEYLLQEDHLEKRLASNLNFGKASNGEAIPRLNLHIGMYEGDIKAYLDLNGKEITNTQILIAGTTGSGKSNLLAALLYEIRGLSVETPYPVNFLLFDYKGEFSDPDNKEWLGILNVDARAILNPMETPLPFSPFKDFFGRPQNEINLYSTEIAGALCALGADVGARMSNRVSEACIAAYEKTKGKPITFDLILSAYVASMPGKEKEDSITSVLAQLIRSNLFSAEDRADIVRESYIVKMDGFPKEGPIAKAIVYFIVSKLNTLYEKLPKQAVGDDCVELRHFTVIDEAHYMLDFENKPLQNLISVGRNKGLSIILATQNMDSYKSDHFDFFANAQYPLIMKQSSLNDSTLKNLFGVGGEELKDLRHAITDLKKGELIIKNPTAAALGLGKKYKKIAVKHLI